MRLFRLIIMWMQALTSASSNSPSEDENTKTWEVVYKVGTSVLFEAYQFFLLLWANKR